jgi:hypothetical protein
MGKGKACGFAHTVHAQFSDQGFPPLDQKVENSFGEAQPLVIPPHGMSYRGSLMDKPSSPFSVLNNEQKRLLSKRSR